MAEVPEIAWNILEVSDKPLTIIYPDAQNLAESLIANDGSVGIRIVQDEFCCRLIRKFGKPIVSTSANISGTITGLVIFIKLTTDIVRCGGLCGKLAAT